MNSYRTFTVPQAINHAADLIEERGLWQGDDKDHNPGSVCVLTALPINSTEVCRYLILTFGLPLPEKGVTLQKVIADWNDAQPSERAVTAPLRLAAALYSQKTQETQETREDT